MSKGLQYFLKPFIGIFMLNVLGFSYSQGKLIPPSHESFWMDSIFQKHPWEQASFDFIKNIPVQEAEVGSDLGSLGLRYVPKNDQNIYFLYNYELVKDRSKAEIGFSMNDFKTLTLTYSYSFSLQELIK